MKPDLRLADKEVFDEINAVVPGLVPGMPMDIAMRLILAELLRLRAKAGE